jgi:hypothetical protein
MNRTESEEKLVASGPFLQEGVLVADGLTILQTNTIKRARAIMQAEPSIECGLRPFYLRPQKRREGRNTFPQNVSMSSFDLG